MRKKVIWGVICLGFLGVCVLVGVRQYGKKTETDVTPAIRAVFFCPTSFEVKSFCTLNALGMLEASEEYEQVEVSVYKRDSSTFSFPDEVLSAISMKADALIAVGVTEENRYQYQKKLEDAGITLCLIDGDLPDSGRFSFVGTDNRTVGQTVAQYLLEVYPDEEISVALFSSEMTESGLADRMEGFCEVAEASERMELVAAETAASREGIAIRRKMETILEEYPGLNAICCLDLPTSAYALQVLRDKGLTDQVRLIGFDCDDEIADAILAGEMEATVLEEPKKMGYQCIQILAEHFGETGTFICYTDCALVTKENMEELWYKEDQR